MTRTKIYERQKRQHLTAVWRNGGFSASYDSFVVGSSAVLRLNFCAKNPPLRQAAKRYVQPYSATVRPSNEHFKLTDNTIFGKAVWLSLRKIKRGVLPPTSRHKNTTFNFAQPHHNHPTNFFYTDNFFHTFAP
ncbi:MAG: hypothetical protein IPM47_20795 [Sphingobacteriales bacterium]|nr:MAG: hypothetical protein IPM47_20795 [Sphingobacteriales bacterium]